jgi:hypothetical protein
MSAKSLMIMRTQGTTVVNTKDKGFVYALKLKRILDASIDPLKRDKNLPEHIAVLGTDTVENPF